MVFRKQLLPDSPVQIQPDFYREIRNKAVKRWSRPFHLHSMAGQTRILSREPRLLKRSLKDRGAEIIVKACLVVPSPRSVRKACEAMVAAQQALDSSCALFLISEDMLGVKDFVHAYCKRGESYRCEPMFRKGEDEPWIHLNQAVHEFWLDPDPESCLEDRG